MEPRWELGVVMDGEKKLEFGGGHWRYGWCGWPSVVLACLNANQF